MWKTTQKVSFQSYKLFHASENFTRKRVNRQLKLHAPGYTLAFTVKIFKNSQRLVKKTSEKKNFLRLIHPRVSARAHKFVRFPTK